MSIKRKIIGLFVLLAVIPIIVGVVFAGQYKALVQERALIRLDAAASNLKERMGLVHKLNSERLAGITSRTHLRLSLARFLDSADPQDQLMMGRILEDALESIPTFKRIQILDTSGMEVVSTGQPVEADVSALVRDAESMGFRHSQFRIGPEGDWELLMMGPLTLLERRIGVAVLFSDLSDVLAEAANDAYLQNSGEVLLAVRGDKSEPRLLGKSPEPNDLTTPSSGDAMLPVIDAIQGKERTYTDILDSRGTPVLAATRYEKNLGLGLVVKIDQSEVYGPLQQLQLRQLSVTSLALFPLFVLAYLMGRSVYLPLARLKSGTEIVGEGNLDYRVGSQASDEIGALSRSFDSMVNKLEGLNRRVTEANQDLEHFTHIAAHDLREPLRQNRSLLDLFVHSVEMDDKVKMADMAAHIRKNSDKMLSMVEDFRVLTKIGQKELTREQVSLESIISEALEVYRVKLEKRKVETILDKHPPEVPVYPGLALLLYTNMVNNALMHAVGDGFTLHFTAEKSKNQWIFGVRNTQSDVGEGDVETIFQMFRTGKSETGSGVGLSICRKVVDRHQGKIWVESRHQVTHFKFTLERE